MNLMKNFNINYLFQNLKKSRTTLAIFLGLIPILNTIILIMTLTNNPNYILNFTEISILSFIGIYFLPVIISICLFNYIYKKKSVDFVNSMPLTRKSIFITNTILGITIFALMLLINTILIWAVTTIFKAPVPLMMLLDYFWYFMIVYIFAFTTTNLAMTISGNAITQIVVTLLLFFLIPFISFYINIMRESNGDFSINLIECNEEACMPEKYYCYDNDYCNDNKLQNRYVQFLNPVTENNYTTPFNLMASLLTYNNDLMSNISIIKMVILSIIYTLLGYFLFLKRKMEVSETSFKNIHIHNLVKSLTLVPMIALSYSALQGEAPIFIIFIIVIMLIYYFIYDLITKKNIQNIKLSLIYFIATLIIVIGIFSLIDRPVEQNRVLNYKDISEIAIDLSDNTSTNNKEKVYIKNKEVISLMTKSMLDTESDGQSHEYIEFYLKTSNNKEYSSQVGLNKINYNKLLDILSKEEKYISTYKDIKLNSTYKVIKLGSKIYQGDAAKPYIEIINNTLKNLSLKEFIELQNKYRSVNNSYHIKLYTYKNHKLQEYSINSYINYDLLNSIVNSNNGHLKENITPIIPDDYYLYYENAYLERSYSIDFYIVRSAKPEIYEFILKNINEKVDMRKEYFSFNITLNGGNYIYTTNKVQEVIDLLNKKQEDLKDNKEYQDYYKEEEVYYYD